MQSLALRWVDSARVVALLTLLGCGAVGDDAGEGGATDGGPCAPRTFLGDRDGGYVVAADERYAFWTGLQGNLYRVDLETSEVMHLAKLDDTPPLITVADGFVYGASHDSLFRIPTEGGPRERLARVATDGFDAIRVVGDDVIALDRFGALYVLHVPTRALRRVPLNASPGDGALGMVADATYAYVLLGAASQAQLLKVSLANFAAQELLTGLEYPTLQRVERGLLLGTHDANAELETLYLVSPTDGTMTYLFSFDAVTRAGLLADATGIFANYSDRASTLPCASTVRWFSWDGARRALVGEARWRSPNDEDRFGQFTDLVRAGPWVFASVHSPAGWPDPSPSAMAFCNPNIAR